MKSFIRTTASIFVIFIVSRMGWSQPLGDYSIRVEVAGNGFANVTRVYFEDDPLVNATYGFDICCEASLVIGNTNQPHLFTEVVSAPYPPGENRLSINAFPHLYEPLDIPLGFLPGQLAAYTFVFKELYRFPPGTQITLEDIPQQTTQDLLLDSVYNTWGAPADDPSRFIIHINPPVVIGVDAEDRKPGFSGNVMDGMFQLIDLDLYDTYKVHIFSVTGELIAQKSTTGNPNFQFSLQYLRSGYYICKVESQSEEAIFRFLR